MACSNEASLMKSVSARVVCKVHARANRPIGPKICPKISNSFYSNLLCQNGPMKPTTSKQASYTNTWRNFKKSSRILQSAVCHDETRSKAACRANFGPYERAPLNDNNEVCLCVRIWVNFVNFCCFCALQIMLTSHAHENSKIPEKSNKQIDKHTHTETQQW